MKFTIVISLLAFFAYDALAMPAPDADIQARGGSCLSHCWHNGNTLFTFVPCFIQCWKYTHQKPDDQGASPADEQQAKTCSAACFAKVEELEKQEKIDGDDERDAAFEGCMAPCEQGRINSWHF
ncbi:hypothetical protein F4775DRAFT_498536 [Biscogniauxia sp. FL1348]|nr:hypothetical protein F4775DRAFT_498536 [Biscogniauxia sp. FL1348]